MAKKRAVKKVKKVKSLKKKKSTLKRRVVKAKKAAKGKKVSAKKAVKKTALKAVSPALQVIGEVTHFFPHVSAGVVKLSGPLMAGDMIQIKGHTTDFKQTVDSLQIEHVSVKEAAKDQEIGIKVRDRVRIGDTVYKL